MATFFVDVRKEITEFAVSFPENWRIVGFSPMPSGSSDFRMIVEDPNAEPEYHGMVFDTEFTWFADRVSLTGIKLTGFVV